MPQKNILIGHWRNLRDEVNAGTKPGFRILAANEGIFVPGGHMADSVAIAAHSIDEALKQNWTNI